MVSSEHLGQLIAFQPHTTRCFGHEAVPELPIGLPCCCSVQMQESSSLLEMCFIQCMVCSRLHSSLDSAGAFSGKSSLSLDLVFVPTCFLDMSCIDLRFLRWPQLYAKI